MMCLTLQVYTMSLHLKEDGFFPGSGDSENVGLGNGRCGLSARLVHTLSYRAKLEHFLLRFYNLNVPLKEGIHDEAYFNIFSE